MLLAAIDHQHASENTKLHALYAYYFLGFNKTRIATIYRKALSTIATWIDTYEKTGSVARQNSSVTNQKYNTEKREWLRHYILANPLSYLDETKHAFELKWHMDISCSTVWRILHDYKFTYKVSLRSFLEGRPYVVQFCVANTPV